MRYSQRFFGVRLEEFPPPADWRLKDFFPQISSEAVLKPRSASDADLPEKTVTLHKDRHV
jgi:hypothetical protein